MRTYILEYGEDWKKVKEEWVVHIKGANETYFGFDTRKAALRFVYNRLRTQFSSVRNKNKIGIISIIQKSHLDQPRLQCGWYHGHAAYSKEYSSGIHDIFRIYSDGTSRMIA